MQISLLCQRECSNIPGVKVSSIIFEFSIGKNVVSMRKVYEEFNF